MKGIFIDASEKLAAAFKVVSRPGDPPVDVRLAPGVAPEELPGLLAGYDFVLDDHSQMPTAQLAKVPQLKHVIYLGTGVRSAMNPEELAAQGQTAHAIKGYGDTAVAEHAFALMFAAARGLAAMDRGVRAGRWELTEGVQLTGKTLGLVGFGGIAAEMARLARGIGMKVLAWNRTQRAAEGVAFVDIDTLLAESHVVSLHLLLTEETRGILDSARLARLRHGAILVNTARAALVDQDAMVAALRDGRIRAAGLDVFLEEPLPATDVLAGMPNVTLSAHSAFRTPEASEKLMRLALDIACNVAAGR